MNFASSRLHPVPRALSLSQEQVETVKTPTPEPQETESRKVGPSLVRCATKICLVCWDVGKIQILFSNPFALRGRRLFKCTVVWSQMKRGPKLM